MRLRVLAASAWVELTAISDVALAFAIPPALAAARFDVAAASCVVSVHNIKLQRTPLSVALLVTRGRACKLRR